MAGTIKVDSINADSNLVFRIANTAVAFIDATGLRPVAGNLNLDATATSKLYLPSANTVAIQTAGVTAVTVNSSQNVTLAAALAVTGAATLSSTLAVTGAATLSSSLGVTGVTTFAAGTAALPAITTTGDTNTGIFFSAADTIDFAEGGTATGQFDSSGNFKFNSGYGSVATAYGCRAWVNFNGSGTPAIRGSGNVSSITDNGTADYTVNFTTAMVDANYAVVYGGATDWRTIGAENQSNITTSGVRLLTRLPSNANSSEVDSVALAIFR